MKQIHENNIQSKQMKAEISPIEKRRQNNDIKSKKQKMNQQNSTENNEAKKSMTLEKNWFGIWIWKKMCEFSVELICVFLFVVLVLWIAWTSVFFFHWF